ncbi:MAG TPA: alpha/beta hydrolase [Micromonosporaceae bacterium]|jgi:pimeloyl-ACP methyl ester carboxylesterase|nr:alpha/beta hydrolase [Micromonosporaceae bacterium]
MAVADLRVPVEPGVELHVRSWSGPDRADPGPGGADRRGFLLVHGLSSNARLWDEVAALLAAAGHPAWAVDLRSHGESDAPADGYDCPTAAADLAAVADAFGLTGLIVAGQSWGGNVVVRLAAQRPDLVAGLALIDGGWIDLAGQFGSWEECAAALRPPELDGLRAERLRIVLRTSHPDWSASAIEATVANLRERPDGTLERRLSIDRHMLIVRSMWDYPPQPLFAQVRAPVLLMPAMPAAEAGAARRREVVAQAATVFPQATIREYAGADHDLHAQHPDEVATDLLTLAVSERANQQTESVSSQ